MKVTAEQVRGHRLRAHHLDAKRPMAELTAAAGACGLQNTPPGAWETALHNRLAGCTLKLLDDALCHHKTLLQAWSFRGAPVVFPAAQSEIFLKPLIAQAGEEPWIYTRGITGALDHLQMSFDDLLRRTKAALRYLDDHTVQSKEALDQTLADIIEEDLPKEKRPLWRDPSMYGSPGRQTVGGAAVSFLLRPCAFSALVVFGRRQGASPTFTSYKNWMGHAPRPIAEAEQALVRKFLHCYGPATPDHFADWLGCSMPQAKRLWNTVAEEMVPVEVEGKARHLLAADRESLLFAGADAGRLILLGPHDPYLDLRDRAVILPDRAHQKTVWQFVSNPGAVLRGGRIIGVWKAKALKNKLDISVTLWQAATAAERKTLEALAREYAAFRRLDIKSYTLDGV